MDEESSITYNLTQCQADLQKHNYFLEMKIGAGKYGTVFLVNHLTYQMKMVAKKLNPQGDLPINTSEIDALIHLDHPNIIRCYEYFIERNSFYIILEYCSNGTLEQMIQKGGPLRGPQLYHYCNQLATVISFCHQKQIAHRDIKPSNILIDQYGRIKLADFGFALQIKSYASKTSHIAGTLPFLPPEAIRGELFSPFVADVWSLGMTFFYMANGTLPWEFHTRQELVKQINSGEIVYSYDLELSFTHLLMQMLDHNPDSRISIEKVLTSRYLKETPDDYIIKKKEHSMPQCKTSLFHTPTPAENLQAKKLTKFHSNRPEALPITSLTSIRQLFNLQSVQQRRRSSAFAIATYQALSNNIET